MTLIVGIKCRNGVVIGSDGAATYVVPFGGQTTTQPTTKLSIIGKHFIFGGSGPAGLSQAYQAEIENKLKNTNNEVTWKTMRDARSYLEGDLAKISKSAWEKAEQVSRVLGQQAALQQAVHASVVVFPTLEEARLVQLDHVCSCEEATKSLPFVSVGSGQATADPFLAFVRRIFFPDDLPTLGDGTLCAIWALDYAIKAQPGHISRPIQVAVLEKKHAGEWVARQLSSDDLGEHEQMIRNIEHSIEATPHALVGTETTPIP